MGLSDVLNDIQKQVNAGEKIQLDASVGSSVTALTNMLLEDEVSVEDFNGDLINLARLILALVYKRDEVLVEIVSGDEEAQITNSLGLVLEMKRFVEMLKSEINDVRQNTLEEVEV